MKTISSSIYLAFVAVVLVSMALLPQVRAVTPAPDGGYPGGNTAEGQNALLSLTTGGFNTAVGFLSLKSDATGAFNTSVGAGTLLANTGDGNTATGAGALLSNTIGVDNTATGELALLHNTTGTFNSAFGQGALFSNTTGVDNTATGAGTLFANTTGTANTATGFQALNDNTIGGANTAVGDGALFANTTGVDNTAVGQSALRASTTASDNTAIGQAALSANTTGTQNTAIGFAALEGNTTGNFNIAIGGGTGVFVSTANNVICLGSAGQNVDNSTWIGNIYQTATISGTTLPVVVSNTGQLGTAPSSKRFKKDIATMEQASEAILALRPVTFHYKTDAKGTPQFGLIAEEVAKVNPALVLPDKEGKPYTVRYDAVNAMLLNEFLKEHRTVQEQKAIIAQLRQNFAQQQRQIETLTSVVHKVSARLELSKPAPQTVKNKLKMSDS